MAEHQITLTFSEPEMELLTESYKRSQTATKMDIWLESKLLTKLLEEDRRREASKVQ